MSSGALIAVVCTANQCRSPLEAAILDRELTRAGVDAAIRSAGTDASGGPATPGTIDAARRLGLDLGTHRSTPLDPELVAAAALVLTMERRHVQDVVIAAPGSFDRTFTLKELVRRGSAAAPRASNETLAEWLGRVSVGRRPKDLLGRSPADDIADPTVDRLVDHDALAAELTELTRRLVALAWPRSD